MPAFRGRPRRERGFTCRRANDFKEIRCRCRLDFILISPGGQLGGANDEQRPDLTLPEGLQFYVDGQKFVSAGFAAWPQGSKHSIRTDSFQNGNQPGMAYTNPQLATNLASQLADPTSITADPALTWIQISFATSYAVSLNYFVCPAGMVPASCGSPGTVY
jgi:hypothetical protein